MGPCGVVSPAGPGLVSSLCLPSSPPPPSSSRLAELTLDQPQRPRRSERHSSVSQLTFTSRKPSLSPGPLIQTILCILDAAPHSLQGREHRPVLQVSSCLCHAAMQGRSQRRYSHRVCPRRPRRRVTTVTAPPGALGCLSFCHSHSRRDTVWVGTGRGFSVLRHRSGC